MSANSQLITATGTGTAIGLDWTQPVFNASFAYELQGSTTATFSVQFTLDDVNNTSVVSTATWFEDANVAASSTASVLDGTRSITGAFSPAPGAGGGKPGAGGKAADEGAFPATAGALKGMGDAIASPFGGVADATAQQLKAFNDSVAGLGAGWGLPWAAQPAATPATPAQ